MRTHTKTFHIRLTEQEYNRLCRNAKKTALPKSTYIRHMINGCLPREQVPAVFWQYVRKSSEVFGSLKNLLYYAQRLGVIDAERLDAEVEAFKKLYLDILYEVVGVAKVDIKEAVERGRQIAEYDKSELE